MREHNHHNLNNTYTLFQIKDEEKESNTEHGCNHQHISDKDEIPIYLNSSYSTLLKEIRFVLNVHL